MSNNMSKEVPAIFSAGPLRITLVSSASSLSRSILVAMRLLELSTLASISSQSVEGPVALMSPAEKGSNPPDMSSNSVSEGSLLYFTVIPRMVSVMADVSTASTNASISTSSSSCSNSTSLATRTSSPLRSSRYPSTSTSTSTATSAFVPPSNLAPEASTRITPLTTKSVEVVTELILPSTSRRSPSFPLKGSSNSILSAVRNPFKITSLVPLTSTNRSLARSSREPLSIVVAMEY